MSTDPLAPLSSLPGVFEGVDAARVSIDTLLREPALRRGRGAIRAETRRRAAWASARLGGSATSLSDFAPPFADDEPGRVAAAALRVAGEVGSLAETWRGAPLQALARLHTLVAVEVADTGMLGRPRDDVEVAARLTELAEVVANTQVSGIVTAAVVHGELLTLKPFGWGDGLVARAAMRVVLVARGVDPDALTVPEQAFWERGAESYLARLADYRSGTPEGLASWLIANAAAVQEGAAIARAVCQGR